MSRLNNRKKELLKPPEIKPVWTYLIIGLSIFTTGETKYQWLQQHTLIPQKFFAAFQKNDLMAMLTMSYNSSFAELGAWSFICNVFFFWLFGSTVEKRLTEWRYPLFVVIGMLFGSAILCYDSVLTPSQPFIGPTMLLTFLMGGYLAHRPRKPFKPAEWKPLPWKIFKEDKEQSKLVLPWVPPGVYVCLFIAYTLGLHLLITLTPQKIVEATHIGFLGTLHRTIMGDLAPDSFAIGRLIPALETLAAGYFAGLILPSIVFKHKPKRDAGDLQIQTFLQYKELRALDMNHRQAVEGSAKLIGVPEEIAKDWIKQGLMPIKDSDESI